jgi:hypothetical protein
MVEILRVNPHTISAVHVHFLTIEAYMDPSFLLHSSAISFVIPSLHMGQVVLVSDHR